MDVDSTLRRQLQHCGRQKKSIRRDHYDICARCSQAVKHLGRAQAFGLKNLKTTCTRQSLHGAGCAVQAPAGRPVRPGQNQCNFMPRLEQPGEGAFSECRGPRKD